MLFGWDWLPPPKQDSQTKKSIVSTVIIGTAVCTQHCGLQSWVGQYHIPEINFHFQIRWKKGPKTTCNLGHIDLLKLYCLNIWSQHTAHVPIQHIPTFATWTFAPSPTWLRAKKVTDGSMLFLCSCEINVCIASDYSHSHRGIPLLALQLAPARFVQSGLKQDVYVRKCKQCFVLFKYMKCFRSTALCGKWGSPG